MGELPPRARRIRGTGHGALHALGTTSACAENTQYQETGTTHHRNYLRVRGEYLWRDGKIKHDGELPPRARRIPLA